MSHHYPAAGALPSAAFQAPAHRGTSSPFDGRGHGQHPALLAVQVGDPGRGLAGIGHGLSVTASTGHRQCAVDTCGQMAQNRPPVDRGFAFFPAPCHHSRSTLACRRARAAAAARSTCPEQRWLPANTIPRMCAETAAIAALNAHSWGRAGPARHSPAMGPTVAPGREPGRMCAEMAAIAAFCEHIYDREAGTTKVGSGELSGRCVRRERGTGRGRLTLPRSHH